MSASVGFDRAVEFYDRTRAIAPEAMERTLALLRSELPDDGRVLEVGVGTGLLALPLHADGMALTGLDLSTAMLRKLVEKAGGVAPFPLVAGDATRMPFGDGAFDAAYLRWVLHLVPAWRALVSEVVRVVRRGGVFLVNHGSYAGAYAEIHERFAELTGTDAAPPGLDWAAWPALDAEIARLGGGVRELPPLDEQFDETVDGFVRGIEEGRYSWTWSVPEEDRRRVGAEIRAWATERFAPIDSPPQRGIDSTWRAYDLA